MELEEFRTWRPVSEDRSHLLLDYDSLKPTRATLQSEDGPIAQVAAAIHSSQQKLTRDDCEHIVRWMKTIKRERESKSQLDSRDWVAFEGVLKNLRDSTSQNELLLRASRLGLGVDARTIAAFVIAGGALALAFVPRLYWLWSGATFLLAVFVYWRSQLRGVAAAEKWKEQDRRYLMESIRAARTVQELSQAGLFAYLPGSEYGPNNDEGKACTALRRERERLTDALYHDPDWWLRD